MKIAIVKLSAMGDIIHAMLALQFIKKSNPDIKIDWFVEEVFAPVLQNNPDIDNIYTLNLKALKNDKKKLPTEVTKVRTYSKNSYDLVIDAQGLAKSAIVSRLLGKDIAGFDRTSTREGVSSYLYKRRISSDYCKNVIERNLDVILTPLNISYTKKEILEKKPFLFFNQNSEDIEKFLSKDKKNILLIIGASWDSKIYSKEKFAKISNILDENVLIAWGSNEEKESAEFISSNSNSKVLPKLNLNDLKFLVSKMDLVIGNDTGPTHMAWALNVPSITIFGCTPGKRNTYITNINKIIESKSKVNPLKLKKEDFSINDINEEDIVKIAKELLNDKKDKGLS
ncbi:lipopolysaccharide heptosyltransferase I [Halarcobacter anaerophilus]|uniref:Lipopolysaccharide heptosyltransferase 1 n=1 Tax=Halarcobacter anaerophilus TaxID=877500 RepID=A0A4Q0Y3Q5_9BACT|nr:lipopolysaccharide heptosyltransferase I [Halarcobacter anaerophilus]QDF29546.1 heptosyltransferase I [Halarcobacter anaerophilus]RXJ64782.1 lipopolysaccharide heptosyltransferase I [Halarcobacter anaerophilus]